MFSKADIKQIVEDSFIQNGIDMFDVQAIHEMDSLQYISVLIGIEDSIGRELPDSLMVRNVFEDMDGFFELLYFLIGDIIE